MAFIADYCFDLALAGVASANKLVICSQEPVTYTEANATYTLGNKATPTIGSAGDRTPNGRKVTISAITDGTVTGTGTASHWALVDTVNSRLLSTGALSSSQAVTSGNTFTLAAFDVGIPDAA